MRLVNETQQEVFYWITCEASTNCGTIDINDFVDLPGFDNQTNVRVDFSPTGDPAPFTITVDDTAKGEQVEMAVVAL